MVEPEVAFNDSDDNMRLQEEFVSYIVARALERRQPELKELERDISKLEKIKAPFPRIDYGDAVRILQEKGSSVKWGDDLGAEDETLLVEGQDRPVFIYNYPKQAKAFYMKENPADPRTVLCDDLLAPEGYGEIIGGSQREDDHDKLLARIKEEGLRTTGISICGSMARSFTPGSGSDWNERSAGSAESTTFARQSHFRER
jgi:asparaginyl-tRNA synthetase